MTTFRLALAPVIAAVIGLNHYKTSFGDSCHPSFITVNCRILGGRNVAVIKDNYRPATSGCSAIGSGKKGINLESVGLIRHYLGLIAALFTEIL